MRSWTFFVLLGLCGCGGVNPGVNPDPIDVIVNVTVAGKPADDLKFNFQPTGPGALPAVFDIVEGIATAKVTPGKYTYFVTAGEDPENFDSVPTAYHQGSMERQLEVKPGEMIEIKLD